MSQTENTLLVGAVTSTATHSIEAIPALPPAGREIEVEDTPEIKVNAAE